MLKLPQILLSALLTGSAASLLAGGVEPVPSHPRVGDSVGADGAVVVPNVTFHRQVSRILQANCQKCHRDGGIAPFPLVTYEDATLRAELIAYQTSNRLMPPWRASSSCSTFVGDPRLSDADVATLSAWVRAAVPEGNPAEAPPPVRFNDGFALGEPDFVLKMAEPFTPDLSKGDVYRCFVIPSAVDETTYLDGVEVIPGNRTMVHHVLLFTDTTGEAEANDAADPGPGYACFGGPGIGSTSPMGAWVPGSRPQRTPEGVGIELPGRASIVMQVHYSALSGGKGSDLTTVGLHVARDTIHKRLLTVPVVNFLFRLPAGQSNVPVSQTTSSVPYDVHLVGIAPHMHLLGKTMNAEATLPSGAQLCLVDVPSWDFRWQGFYTYTNAIPLPSGTRVHVDARYDNSSANPNNPNVPPKDVFWGEKTTDEMFLCYLLLTLDVEDLAAGLRMPVPKL